MSSRITSMSSFEGASEVEEFVDLTAHVVSGRVDTSAPAAEATPSGRKTRATARSRAKAAGSGTGAASGRCAGAVGQADRTPLTWRTATWTFVRRKPFWGVPPATKTELLSTETATTCSCA
jgi:hypothetical protein